MASLSRLYIGVTAKTIRTIALLRREMGDTGIVANPANNVAIPPKGHAPTAEEILLRESVDVRIADEGGVSVVGVLIGTDEYVLERAMGVVKEIGAGRLVRCFANTPEASAIIAI